MSKKRLALAVLAVLVLSAGWAAAGEKIEWSPRNPKAGEEVTFTFDASDGEQVTRWEFGDGTESSGGESARHTYRSGGDYTVKVKVRRASTQITYERLITIDSDS